MNLQTITRSLGQQLKELRGSSSLVEIGHKVGVTGNYIGMLEAGKRMPSLKVLLALCQIYGCEITLKGQE